ncbi:MAG: SDR family NAD(P)-dependent oxidoreductase [Bdellovibrionota bacterium]
MKLLITGGSSEIAFALARRRVQLGDEVWITASSADSLKETLAEYKKEDVNVKGMVFNLSDPAASEGDFTQFDSVVLNAATRTIKLRKFTDWDEAAGAEYLRTNIDGNLWLLQRCIPGMAERKFGRVVFISSLSALQGTSRFAFYCAAKSALEGLFLNLAVDYGEDNVYFNMVRPGVIATERTKRFWKRSHYLEKMQEIIPSKALGAPSQVAEAMDPLLSATSYMNGTSITVSGGLPLLRSAGVLGV